MNFLRLNHFLKRITNYQKRENKQSATWQPLGVPRVMLMSALGQPFSDIILAFDDVSIDVVNIDQVNGSKGRVSLSHL